MYSRLAIDTTTGTVAGPSSANPRYRRTPSPAGPKLPGRRVRSISNASSTSSLNIVSPLSSSTNGSQTSLLIPDAANETARARSRSASPGIEDTVRLGADYVLAMHDYSPTNGHATCLSFRAGQVIHVLNRDSSGWWDGELDNRRGWFPSNYVSSDIINLRDEEPLGPSFSPRHSHSNSAASATSWISSTSSLPRQTHSRTTSTSTTGSNDDENESYCPPLMVPLLHGLTLLQNAVRANRITHFQPSTACIISCVRSTLSATDTLDRGAPVLRIHTNLADERRRILTVLAQLVAQAKKASNDSVSEETQAEETAAMVRLAGQVFANVRRFLSVAAECGVELPDEPDPSTGLSIRSDDGEVDTPVPSTGRTPTQHQTLSSQQSNGATPMGRTRSQSDLRGRSLRSPIPYANPGSMSANPVLNGRMRQEQQYSSNRMIGRGHKYNQSTSSISSISSFSSQDSGASNPSSPAPFPNGPSSASQVLDALRHTHDQYLSTIAAFIGHAHSHSRTSHASSTGQLYDLVREIVELVCKLLTIVEAVMQHPDVPGHRIGSLKAAKEGLFNVTSSLAESVRLLTMSLPSSLSEEDEKKALLHSATSALKAGADCVASVKVCLTRSLGDRPFIVNLPNSTDLSQPFTPNKLNGANLGKLVQEQEQPIGTRINGYHLSGMDDEDLTIQAVTPSPAHRHYQKHHDQIPQPLRLQREGSESSEHSNFSDPSSRQQSVDTLATSVEEQYQPPKPPPKGLAPLRLTSHVPVEPDLGSPTSFVRSDDGTTWEGSIREHPAALRPGADHMHRRMHSQSHSAQSHDHDGLPPLPHDMPDFPQDPTTWMLSHDYSMEDVAYNNEGHLVGATMDALVEKMTPHDSLVDPAFSAVFFLTFRLFSSPTELVDAIINRYNLSPPHGITREDESLWQQQKGIPVRLRVSNFIKTWLDTYWRPGVDDPALPSLTAFTSQGLALLFPGPAQRIMDLLNMRRQSSDMTSPRGDRSRDPGMLINPPSMFSPTAQEIPRPTMTKTLLSALRKKEFASITVTDFDALELARQLTIMECDLYCAIQPNEILESGTEGAAPPVNVRAVSSLSTVITGWVAESILDELDLKKRTLLVKFFVKLSDRCVVLQNYSTSRSILAALDSSTISRLRQTWAGLPQKYKVQMEALRKLADHSRNYHEYRSRLRNTSPPAVPFLGLYLTDVTFCREGNPSHRPSPRNPAKKLINFNKYHKLARIVQDMQRFQVPYNLKGIPEVQEYLNVAFERARHHGDLQDLYRRSLLVEPKQPADSVPANEMRQLFNWATRSGQAAAT